MVESSDIPVQLSKIQSLNVDIAWTMGPGDVPVASTVQADLDTAYVKANVAFDVFLDPNSKNAGDPTKAGYEFMVWLASYGGTQPLGWATTASPLTHTLNGQLLYVLLIVNDLPRC